MGTRHPYKTLNRITSSYTYPLTVIQNLDFTLKLARAHDLQSEVVGGGEEGSF